jgi:hypothetical protein
MHISNLIILLVSDNRSVSHRNNVSTVQTLSTTASQPANKLVYVISPFCFISHTYKCSGKHSKQITADSPLEGTIIYASCSTV